MSNFNYLTYSGESKPQDYLLNQVWWCTCVISATQETKAEVWQVQSQSEQLSETVSHNKSF